MPPSNIAWGIEIGATAIKALKLEVDGQKVNALDFIRLVHPKPLSTPGVDKADVLRVSLGQLVSQYDLSKATIAVSIPGHSSFARFAKLPPVEPKKVPDIVKFEAMQQIPFPLEQVEWDFQTFVSPDSPDVEVGIFAITKDRIQETLQLLGDVGITPNLVTLGPLAVWNALAYDLGFTNRTEGTIMVDVGTQSTDLIVAEAGRVWVRTFPLGGHQFTEALTSTFQITYPKAEKLKQEAEEPKHARQVFQAMRPVFTDLGQDIQRSIGYYQSLHKDANLSRIIGMGSTFQLPGLRKYLKQQLSLEVYRVEEFKRLNLDTLDGKAGGPRAEEFAKHSIEFATAYGLALQGLNQQTIDANLMPLPVVREAMWRGKVKWFGLAATIGVIAGAAMFIRPLIDSTAVAAALPDPVIAQAVNQGRQLKSDAEQAQVLGAAETDARAANMVALLENRELYGHLVNDLGLMFEDAAGKSRGWAESTGAPPDIVDAVAAHPGFKLRAVSTTYVAPTSAEAAAAQPEPSAGGGRRGGPFGGGDGNSDGGLDAGADSGSAAGATGPADRQRIVIRMEVSTAEPDAQRFMLETMDAWLKANAQRTGVPYDISIASQPWRVTGVVDASGTATEQPGAGNDPLGGDQADDGELGGGGNVPGRPRRGPRNFGGGPPGMPGEFGNPPGSGGYEIGGPGSGGEAGASDVAALAPLTSLRPPPPKTQTNFVITWTAVVKPPVTPGEQPPAEAATPAGGAQ